MQRSLQGRHGIVIGAGYGVGRAISIHLARQGVLLSLGGRSLDRLKATADRIATETGAVPAYSEVDAASEASLAAFRARTKDRPCDFVLSTVCGHIGEDQGKSLEDVT